MGKKLSNEREPSPESMKAFSELVEREAYRKSMLGERRDWARPPPAKPADCSAWRPLFKIEDFSCCTLISILGRPETLAGNNPSSSTAGAKNGSWEGEGSNGARKGVKRKEELSSLVADGEEVRKKAATREVKGWDLNKGVDS